MHKNIFSCKNKTALVVGGAGLIGREIVKSLVDFGANVYIGDTDRLSAKRFKSKSAQFVYMDITDRDSVRVAINRVYHSQKKIDILVNCAYPRSNDWGLKLEQVTFDSWVENVNSHMGGYFMCTKAVAELMKNKKSGSIINFSSIYGVVAPDFSIYDGSKMTMPVAYSAIKGGIIALTKYFATYYAKYNIRANLVSPGGVFNGQSSVFLKKYTEKVPLNRMALPEDIVGSVIFLASDASKYITGQNIIVDGGWSVW